jgi:hypothetical protein
MQPRQQYPPLPSLDTLLDNAPPLENSDDENSDDGNLEHLSDFGTASDTTGRTDSIAIAVEQQISDEFFENFGLATDQTMTEEFSSFSQLLFNMFFVLTAGYASHQTLLPVFSVGVYTSDIEEKEFALWSTIISFMAFSIFIGLKFNWRLLNAGTSFISLIKHKALFPTIKKITGSDIRNNLLYGFLLFLTFIASYASVPPLLFMYDDEDRRKILHDFGFNEADLNRLIICTLYTIGQMNLEYIAQAFSPSSYRHTLNYFRYFYNEEYQSPATLVHKTLSRPFMYAGYTFLRLPPDDQARLIALRLLLNELLPTLENELLLNSVSESAKPAFLNAVLNRMLITYLHRISSITHPGSIHRWFKNLITIFAIFSAFTMTIPIFISDKNAKNDPPFPDEWTPVVNIIVASLSAFVGCVTAIVAGFNLPLVISLELYHPIIQLLKTPRAYRTKAQFLDVFFRLVLFTGAFNLSLETGKTTYHLSILLCKADFNQATLNLMGLAVATVNMVFALIGLLGISLNLRNTIEKINLRSYTDNGLPKDFFILFTLTSNSPALLRIMTDYFKIEITRSYHQLEKISEGHLQEFEAFLTRLLEDDHPFLAALNELLDKNSVPIEALYQKLSTPSLHHTRDSGTELRERLHTTNTWANMFRGDRVGQFTARSESPRTNDIF